MQYLNALSCQDDFGDQGEDVPLVVDGVSDTLQQRLHWCHTLYDRTTANQKLLKIEKHQSGSNLKHKQTSAHFMTYYYQQP